MSNRAPSGADLDAARAAARARRCSRRCRRPLGLVDAVRQRRELGPRAPLGVVEQLLHRRERSSSRPCRVDERLDAAHARRCSPRPARGSRRRSRASSGSARGRAGRRRPRSGRRATSLTGGMITPSWNTSRNAPIDAGAPPPTSTWCARFATYPSSSPSRVDGRDQADVVQVHAARVRVVREQHVARAEVLRRRTRAPPSAPARPSSRGAPAARTPGRPTAARRRRTRTRSRSAS